MIDRRQLLLSLATAGIVAGCAVRKAGPAAPVAMAPVPPPVPAGSPPGYPTVGFDVWLAGLRVEALGKGIRPATFDDAFAGFQPAPRALELDKKQPENTITFEQYVKSVVNPNRVKMGRQRLADNRALLDEIGAKYHVQPRFIVALWGIETDFGASTGNFSIVGALATLAYQGRRGTYFRGELIAALQILDQGHIKPQDLKGSWAGAMGQTQFMPSSYLNFAVDYDHGGMADIWTNRADVFASIANYLSRSGWDGDHGWGREVTVPAGLDPGLIGGSVIKPLSAWQALGVRRSDGGPLPSQPLEAGLVQPGGPGGVSLLTYGNYRVIMKWNRSTYFATSVSYLADRIESW